MTILGILAMCIIPLTSLLLLRVQVRPGVEKVPSWATASSQLAARTRGLQRVTPQDVQAPALRSHQGHFVRAGARGRFGANV